MFPILLPVAADFQVVALETNPSPVYVHGSNMRDPNLLLPLNPGDSYFTSAGEKVTIVSLRDYTLNAEKVHKGGAKAYTIKDSTNPNRVVQVRVY